jgi:RNA polymerase sigma-70 factor (ECF subfamily)
VSEDAERPKIAVTDRGTSPQAPGKDAGEMVASDEDGAPRLREIFRTESSYVWNTLRRLGVRPSDLEDVTHDVFVVVHRKLADYDPSRPLRPWLFGIALRVASDYRRCARIQRERITDDLDREGGGIGTEEQLETARRRALVMKALEALGEDQRLVFVRHELEGISIPEIAAMIGIQVNTAYSRLRLARERFVVAVRALAKEPGDAAREPERRER